MSEKFNLKFRQFLLPKSKITKKPKPVKIAPSSPNMPKQKSLLLEDDIIKSDDEPETKKSKRDANSLRNDIFTQTLGDDEEEKFEIESSEEWNIHDFQDKLISKLNKLKVYIRTLSLQDFQKLELEKRDVCVNMLYEIYECLDKRQAECVEEEKIKIIREFEVRLSQIVGKVSCSKCSKPLLSDFKTLEPCKHILCYTCCFSSQCIEESKIVVKCPKCK